MEDTSKIIDQQGKDATNSPAPLNASAEVRVDADYMKAHITVLPPQNGGKEIDIETMQQALQKAGVVYGISEESLRLIIKLKRYNKPVQVAQGTLPTDGTEGKVEELFQRTITLRPTQKEDGNVDYKELGAVVSVQKGTKICAIQPSTQGIAGKNVVGKLLPAKDGKPLVVPQGENTKISEDGTQLVAAIDGSLRFQNGKFHVDKAFHVHGNIDNSIGNIRFDGDVIVDGDLTEGYEIHSKGDVTVKGVVTGGSIFTEGAIQLIGGMNGSGRGILQAGKSIKSRYLESCTVRTKGSLETEAIINSEVYCNEELHVTTGKGAIIGGTYTVFKLIEAKTIGARSNIATTLVLGATPDQLNEKEELEKRVKELRSTQDEIEKNLSYLEQAAQKSPLSEQRQSVYTQLKRQKIMHLMELGEGVKRLESINAKIEDVKESRLKCDKIYPPARVTIGSATLQVQDVHERCLFYYADNESEVRMNHT